MKRSLLGLALVAALFALSACAEENPRAMVGASTTPDDDAAATVEETDDTAGRDAYVDALAETMTREGPSSDITLESDEAACAAEGVVDAIGLETLRDAITPEEIRESSDEATDLWDLDLSREQGEDILGEMIRCAPVIGELMAESLAFGMTDALGEDTEVTIDTECLAGNTEAVRTLGAIFLTQGGAFTLDASEADLFYDWLAGCTDMRHLTVAVMTDEGIPETGAACINERMDDDLLRRFWVEVMVHLDDLDALDTSPIIGELALIFEACAAAIETTDI